MRHPLAVLRHILRMNQAQLGELCGHSGRTIQAVELGKLALSEGLAHRIAQATGISVEWLLNGDPTVPPKADCPAGMRSPERAYHYEVYEAHRAAAEVETHAAAGEDRQNTIEQVADSHSYHDEMVKRDRELLALCAALLERTRSTNAAAVIRWRIRNFLDELDAQNPVFARDSRRKVKSPASHRSRRP